MGRRKSSAAPAVGHSDGRPAERRRYHLARDAFDCACSMLEPFFHPETGWQGRSLHHVSFNLVTENFPHLPQDEVHALLDAAQRTLIGRLEASGRPAC